MKSKSELFTAGVELAERFCQANSIPKVQIHITQRLKPPMCGLYNFTTKQIQVAPHNCPAPCRRYWPGWIDDATPYGVIAHELGHHWHGSLGKLKVMRMWSNFVDDRVESRTTAYAKKNLLEDVAESFMLFVTNPTLLKAVHPQRYEALSSMLRPVENLSWDEILCDSPWHMVLAKELVSQVCTK